MALFVAKPTASRNQHDSTSRKAGSKQGFGAKLMWTWLEFRLRCRMSSSLSKTRRFDVKYGVGQFRCVVSSPGDLLVLRDVFVDGEYQLPARFRPRTIVDLGSNVGLSVAFFKLSYPDAAIVAVEPDLRTLALLEENTSSFKGVT